MAQYWLCVQPRCDSVLKAGGKRFFPLLPLEIVTEGKFNLVIKNSHGKYVLLKLTDRVYAVKMECFSCSSGDGNSIIAKLEDTVSSIVLDGNANSEKAFIFKTTEGTMYRWIAELKRDHAQRIVNSFASNLSRVGLNESEWLRRSAQ